MEDWYCMEEDGYESLPDGSPMAAHMFAGACAGILEHTVMYPVDCVKTRLQCLKPASSAQYRGLIDGLHQIVVKEGLPGTVRGISVVVGGAAPAHALYFAAYEHLKRRLTNPEWKHGNVFAHGASACCATLLHDAIMTPTDAVKQRLQMHNSPYTGGRHCFNSMLHKEGARSFFRAYTTQMSMNVPHQCVHFCVYEFFQEVMNPEKVYAPVSHMISGALAGGAAAATTTPLDVCKTLLNTQEQGALTALRPAPIEGLFDAAKVIYRLGGPAGFFKGMVARVVFQMPGTAIAWSVYEFFKYALGAKSGSPAEPTPLTSHMKLSVVAATNSPPLLASPVVDPSPSHNLTTFIESKRDVP